ncbi:MAG: hypothetical protein JETT_2205 [Candidatus Jettenia ecosi]|uniref:Uncharacterized protein n=1 Tax=Candidatus Jettenia ecosi TaxID=2494326 RepID=A0A533Q9Y3_9BACT|nr:MAG: hypothetical protein JETT_2205 [Candidatus Jettenia ecosi]
MAIRKDTYKQELNSLESLRITDRMRKYQEVSENIKTGKNDL